MRDRRLITFLGAIALLNVCIRWTTFSVGILTERSMNSRLPHFRP